LFNWPNVKKRLNKSCLIIFSAMALMLIGFVGIWKSPSIRVLLILRPIYGIAYGSLITIFPIIIGNYYGAEVFADINGFFAPFPTVVGSIIPTAAGYAVENFGSYNGIFLILTVLLVCGLILSAFLALPERKAALS